VAMGQPKREKVVQKNLVETLTVWHAMEQAASGKEEIGN